MQVHRWQLDLGIVSLPCCSKAVVRVRLRVRLRGKPSLKTLLYAMVWIASLQVGFDDGHFSARW